MPLPTPDTRIPPGLDWSASGVLATPIRDALDKLEAEIPIGKRGYADLVTAGGSTRFHTTELRLAARLGQMGPLIWSTSGWASAQWGTGQYSYGARLGTTW